METRKKTANLIIAFSVLLASLAFTYYALAGNPYPDAPPGGTMHSLEDIYSAIGTASSGVFEREGYCEYHTVAGTTTATIFTVPAGKCFILLKLHLHAPLHLSNFAWKVIASDPLDGETTLLNGTAANDKRDQNIATRFTYWWDFPDRCVVVTEGQALNIVNNNTGTLGCHIIGYFYDVP